MHVSMYSVGIFAAQRLHTRSMKEQFAYVSLNYERDLLNCARSTVWTRTIVVFDYPHSWYAFKVLHIKKITNSNLMLIS